MTVIREARKIVEETLDLNTIKATQIVIGVGYTGVKRSNNDAGVCHSLIAESNPDCCEILKQAGTVTDTPIEKLLDLTESWDLFERIIGVATLNALSQTALRGMEFPLLKENLIDVLKVEPSDTVTMIGGIKPFIEPLTRSSKKLIILERGAKGEGIYPDTACEELVPELDVVIITGSTLANGTIDRLLQLSRNARKIAVVGPTISIVPTPLFKRNVDYGGGIQITDPDRLMTVLQEAGGTPQMKQAGTLITYLNQDC